MALKDSIPVGMSLPHRSPDPIDMATVRRVAERAEALGFSDLWVTENTLDHAFSFDPASPTMADPASPPLRSGSTRSKPSARKSPGVPARKSG